MSQAHATSNITANTAASVVSETFQDSGADRNKIMTELTENDVLLGRGMFLFSVSLLDFHRCCDAAWML